MPANNFQVKIRGKWEDFQTDEDMILKHAFQAGFPVIVYTYHEQAYRCDFKNMTKKNIHSDRVHEIRPPYTWRPPSQTTQAEVAIFVQVGPNTEGTTIQIQNPENEKHPVFVAVPQNAKVGQAMLVPIVPIVNSPPAMPMKTKAALATSGLLAAGSLAVAGLMLGDVLTGGGGIEELGEAAATVGKQIGNGLSSVGSVVDDGVDAAGDLVTQFF